MPENLTKAPPLHVYLAAERSKGVIDFHIRVAPPRYPGDSEIRFYIHPRDVSGDTADYSVSADPEREGSDFIYNLQAVPEPDVAAFKEQLRERAFDRRTRL